MDFEAHIRKFTKIWNLESKRWNSFLKLESPKRSLLEGWVGGSLSEEVGKI